jgi:16S rRNA G1207 methylase RsmC
MVRATLPSLGVAAAADDRPAARPDGRTEHYFSEAPTVRHRPGQVLVEAAGDRFGLVTDAGTFSPRRLDPGTAFLLDAAPPPPEPSGGRSSTSAAGTARSPSRWPAARRRRAWSRST